MSSEVQSLDNELPSPRVATISAYSSRIQLKPLGPSDICSLVRSYLKDASVDSLVAYAQEQVKSTGLTMTLPFKTARATLASQTMRALRPVQVPKCTAPMPYAASRELRIETPHGVSVWRGLNGQKHYPHAELH
ncbi:hypothetical protein JHW43_009128 [Diplocarpon mali]|nr:hypothetical protein JHW43_009128 [Diplocarpon mali]